MPAKDSIAIEGKIIAVLPGTMFRVEIANQQIVLAHISGKMRKRFIRLTAGDRVRMEMSPYDTGKARIVYRLGWWGGLEVAIRIFDGLFALDWSHDKPWPYRPRYLVVACAVAELLVGGAVHGLVFQPITRRFGPFIAFMLSLIIAVAVTTWYLYFDEEPVTIRLTLAGSIGIAAVLLYRLVNAVRFLQKPAWARELEEHQRFQFWMRK
jgi:translation initiation factor IF-1